MMEIVLQVVVVLSVSVGPLVAAILIVQNSARRGDPRSNSKGKN